MRDDSTFTQKFNLILRGEVVKYLRSQEWNDEQCVYLTTKQK